MEGRIGSERKGGESENALDPTVRLVLSREGRKQPETVDMRQPAGDGAKDHQEQLWPRGGRKGRPERHSQLAGARGPHAAQTLLTARLILGDPGARVEVPQDAHAVAVSLPQRQVQGPESVLRARGQQGAPSPAPPLLRPRRPVVAAGSLYLVAQRGVRSVAQQELQAAATAPGGRHVQRRQRLGRSGAGTRGSLQGPPPGRDRRLCCGDPAPALGLEVRPPPRRVRGSDRAPWTLKLSTHLQPSSPLGPA
jgi:hypothetical protein